MMKKNHIDTTCVVLFFICCLGVLSFLTPYTQYTKEQLSLFALNVDTLSAYLSKPAVLAGIVGDWLTQFYLWRGVAAVIITLVLLGVWAGMRLALRRLGVTAHASLWALLPVGSELALTCHVEYPLTMSVGLLMSLWLFLLVTQISVSRRAVWRTVAHLIALPVLYVMAGAPCLAYALLALTDELRRSRYLPALTLLSMVVAMPLAGYTFYLLSPAQSCYYPLIGGYLWHSPFIFMMTEAALLLALLPLCGIRLFHTRAFALVLTVVWTGGTISYVYDAKCESDLAFSSEAYFGRWDKVLRMSKQSHPFSALSTYYTNLAYARKGELPEQLMQHLQPAHYGLLQEVNEKLDYLHDVAACDALLACGDQSGAQHAALVGMTFTPRQRSTRLLRKLSDIALVNGDYDVARKYLHLLSQTTLHRHWAEERLHILNSGQQDSIPAWNRARQLLPKSDTLYHANQWRISLSNLLDGYPQNQIAADYLLCYSLLQKATPEFKADYDRHYYPVYSTPPRLYQEALLMCIPDSADESAYLKHYHISPAVYSECRDYIALRKQVPPTDPTMRQRFGKTYWFYFDFAQIKRTEQ
jgi:hypothetical protein